MFVFKVRSWLMFKNIIAEVDGRSNKHFYYFLEVRKVDSAIVSILGFISEIIFK